MNSRVKKTLSGCKRGFRLLALGLVALCCASFPAVTAGRQAADPDLTVHEWGTFTAIAGNDGQAVEWLPLTGSTDLPSFVEHFRNANFKIGLRGTVRMETPVLYFYAPHDVTVSVRVAFFKGIITEWYPHATQVGPNRTLNDWALRQMETNGSIAWHGVTVSPNLVADFPREARENHYYAARETSAAPLRVNTPKGSQQEKFLFYRGVSALALPVLAKLKPEGQLLIKNLSGEDIPTVILFERRGKGSGIASPVNCGMKRFWKLPS